MFLRLKNLLFPQERSSSPHFDKLKEKFESRQSDVVGKVWTKHADVMQWAQKTFSMHQLTAGSLGGVLLLSAPSQLALPKPQVLLMAEELEKPLDKNVFLTVDLVNATPKEVRPLQPDEEEKIGKVLSKQFGFTVRAELEGKRLNRSYGYIGAEQHLARYPGDTMSTHFDNGEDAAKYGGSGMAPGLGAYRYFAPSKGELTAKEIDREKYYLAVQTFLAPGFLENTREMYEFFRFRKMLVVNPENGKAMVVVIGDAGPAQWTGKHLGGSPEVMKYLERVDGKQKGPVLYFFVDDPEDKIPLGPVTPVTNV